MREKLKLYVNPVLIGAGIGAAFLTSEHHTLFQYGGDKIMHFWASYAIADFCSKLKFNGLAKPLAVLSAGVSWEAIETQFYPNDGFNSDYANDLLYDMLGVLPTYLKWKKD